MKKRNRRRGRKSQAVPVQLTVQQVPITDEVQQDRWDAAMAILVEADRDAMNAPELHAPAELQLEQPSLQVTE